VPELQGVWFHASTRKEAFMQPFPSDANSKAIAYWPQPGIAMERQRRANQSSTQRGICQRCTAALNSASCSARAAELTLAVPPVFGLLEQRQHGAELPSGVASLRPTVVVGPVSADQTMPLMLPDPPSTFPSDKGMERWATCGLGS
jgi:hypothetical protein